MLSDVIKIKFVGRITFTEILKINSIIYLVLFTIKNKSSDYILCMKNIILCYMKSIILLNAMNINI